MTTSTAHLPLTLRRESFGGILFDPLDAAFVEVDPEAYGVLAGFAAGRPPAGEAARQFLVEVADTVTGLDRRAIRVVAAAAAPQGAPVPVLSAPTLVDFQITDKCHLDCPHCYASSTSAGAHGALADIDLALDQLGEDYPCRAEDEALAACQAG